MKGYMFDENNKNYLGEYDLQIDPLESKKKGELIYLVPKNCSIEKPINFTNDEYIFFKNGKWEKEKIIKEKEKEKETIEETLDNLKEIQIKIVKNKTHKDIISTYSLYKQININALNLNLLTGVNYTQEEKNTMNSEIDAIRIEGFNKQNQIKACTTIEELQAMEV